MKVVEGLFYSKDHEWVKLDGDVAVVGITDFAQNSLGDIVFVELPEISDSFSAGDTFGTIESVKAASDLLLPLSGEVIEVNTELENDPALVNNDPYENWIVKIKVENSSETENLLDAAGYEKFCSLEG